MTDEELNALLKSITEAMYVAVVAASDTELAKRGLVLMKFDYESNMIKYALADGIEQAATKILEEW
tara:strand:- start:190 stop:387 length:198 start_codon:yes stop_codon:yes gene_type:complete